MAGAAIPIVIETEEIPQSLHSFGMTIYFTSSKSSPIFSTVALAKVETSHFSSLLSKAGSLYHHSFRNKTDPLPTNTIQQNDTKMKDKHMGKWLVIGITIGVAVGVAMGNIAIGIGVGVAIGVAIGASNSKNEKDNHPNQD